MHFAILMFSYGELKESYEELRLIEEARKRKIKMDFLSSSHLYWNLNSKECSAYYKEIKLDELDGLIPRVQVLSFVESRIALLKHLEARPIALLNTHDPIIRAKNKILTLELLNQYGVPHPSSVVIEDSDSLPMVHKQVGGYPLILKDPFGTYGHGVILAESERSARSILDRLFYPWGTLHAAIIQEFVKEAKDKDTRIFVINGKVVAAMTRQAKKGEFRSNAELGGECKAIKPSKKQIEIALKATEALGLDVAGVDVLDSKDGPIVIEVNANPGFKALEKATGINVAGLMIEALIDKVNASKKHLQSR